MSIRSDFRKATTESVEILIEAARAELNRVKYSYPKEDADMAFVRDRLEGAIKYIRTMEELEESYAALDSRAHDLMIPQFMRAPALFEDAPVAPPVLFNAFPEEGVQDDTEAVGF